MTGRRSNSLNELGILLVATVTSLGSLAERSPVRYSAPLVASLDFATLAARSSLHFTTSSSLTSLLTRLASSLDLLTLPILGALSDYLGRRRVMLFCLFLALLQIIILFPPDMALNFWGGETTYYDCLIASRVLSGISDGVIPITFASLTDMSGGNALAMPIFYGKVGLVLGLAFTTGPISGALLYAKTGGISAPIIVAMLSSVTSLVVYVVRVEDTLPPSRRTGLPQRWWVDAGFWFSLTPLNQIKFLLASPLLVAYVIVYYFHEFADAVYMSWILYFEWR